MLCEFCKKITPPHPPENRNSNPWSHTTHLCLVRHHANFEELIQSARRGCELCELFRPFIESGQRKREAWNKSNEGYLPGSGRYQNDPFEDITYNGITIRLNEDIIYEDDGKRYYIQSDADDDRNDGYFKKFNEILEREEAEDKDAGLGLVDMASPKNYEIIQWLLQGKDKAAGPKQIWITGWPYIDNDMEAQVGTSMVFNLSAGSIKETPHYTDKETYCVDGKHMCSPTALAMEVPSLWKWKHLELAVPREEPLKDLKPVFEFYQNWDDLIGSNPYITGRGIVQDPQSEACFSLARGWLSTCQSSHDRCRRLLKLELPTRLIDVGPSDGSHIPKLCVTDSSNASAPYATLSHCWGPDPTQMSILTGDNFKEMTQGIEISTLSKNFRDAIIITRALGLQFIWIDALCIIQKSKEDWALESAKMGQYYKGGTVMISALASSNAYDGILKTRDVDVNSVRVSANGADAFIRPVLHDALSVRDSSDRYCEARNPISIQPLNDRAWALQERLFAPRIIHFTSQQMIWECKTCVASEDNQYHFNNYNGHRSDLIILERGQPNAKEEPAKRPSIMSTGWFNLVEAYTSRHITYNSDLLPGLSGLASSLQELTGFIYVAGLWYGKPTVFIRSLLWSVASDNLDVRNEEAIPSRNGSPSWSWASIEGKITYDNQHSSRYPLEALDPIFFMKEVKLATSNPFGQLTGGKLGVVGQIHTFKGPTTFAEFQVRKSIERWSTHKEPVDRKECTYFDRSYQGAGISWKSVLGNNDPNEDSIDITLDFPNPDYDWHTRQHYILFMSVWDRDKGDPDDYNEHQEYLLLRRAEGKEAGTFERVGIAEVYYPHYLDVSEAEGWLRRKLYIV